MDRAKRFKKAHKRVMVNFTNREWEEIETGRTKGQSDSALVKSWIWESPRSKKETF